MMIMVISDIGPLIHVDMSVGTISERDNNKERIAMNLFNKFPPNEYFAYSISGCV